MHCPSCWVGGRSRFSLFSFCTIIMDYSVILFYRYMPIALPEELCHLLRSQCSLLSLKGRILVSAEGLNGTLSGSQECLKNFIDWTASHDPRFSKIDWKFSTGRGDLPFNDLFVKNTRELIGSGLVGQPKAELDHFIKYSDTSFGGLDQSCVGQHLDAESFHAAISSSTADDVIIDVRNAMEYNIGHFKGATSLQTDYFSQSWDRIDSIVDDKHLDGTNSKSRVFM